MPPGPITAQQLISNAFVEAGIYDPSENPEVSDFSFGLSKLNRTLDAYNSDDLYIFATDYLDFILQPNIQPLTIGQAVNITSASLTGNIATYIGANGYQEGDTVSVQGCTTSALNVLNQLVTSATANQFTTSITNADIPSENETNAMAIYASASNQFPTYATTNARPTSIFNANIVLNNLNPIVNCPLRIRDRDWWIANTIPQVPTSIPTDLYYDPSYPNGQIYLWPLQNLNYGLQLQVSNLLSGLSSLQQPFFFSAPGYEDAVTYDLAVALCPSYGRPLDPTLKERRNEAINRIQNRNSFAPKMSTRDSGIPRGGRGGTLFNWLNGTTVPPR